MRSLFSRFKGRLREERGAQTLEWILIGAGVAILITGMMVVLSPKISSTTVKIGETIGNGADKIGSLPVFQQGADSGSGGG